MCGTEIGRWGGEGEFVFQSTLSSQPNITSGQNSWHDPASWTVTASPGYVGESAFSLPMQPRNEARMVSQASFLSKCSVTTIFRTRNVANQSKSMIVCTPDCRGAVCCVPWRGGGGGGEDDGCSEGILEVSAENNHLRTSSTSKQC